MRKYKVGLVGVRRGSSYLNVFSKNPRTEITAVCDIKQEPLVEIARQYHLSDKALFTNYNDFINSDFDIVVLGTPIPFHAEETVAALENGKHVLSEVTAADTIEGCENIFNVVKRSKYKYMMAENCIYMHFCQQWKKYVDAGKLGPIYYAEADYVHEIRNLVIDPATDSPNWRAQRPPIHYCSHSLGPLLYLMDDYVIKATCSGKNKTLIRDVGPGAIDIQVALFETAKGACVKVLRSSVACRKPPLCTYGIYGKTGFLESGRENYENIGRRYFEGEDSNGVNIVCSPRDFDAPKETLAGGHGSSEYYLVNDFLDAVEFDKNPTIDVVKSLEMTVPGIIAHEAAMEGNVWKDVPVYR